MNQKKKEEQEKKKKEEEEERKKKEEQAGQKKQDKDKDKDKDEDQKGGEGEESEGENGDDEGKPKRTPEEEAFLASLRHERKYRASMRMNDGKGRSPLHGEKLPEMVDEADQFSPDSWVPRSDKLIRLTGKHPLNAECDLTELFEAGLITPSSIHYVRNHSAVPHLLWENHKLTVHAGREVTFTMDDLKEQFESINIPIFLACDGNRRKELNMIKRTKAFNFTAAAAGCSYWRGVLLRDVLLEAGVNEVVKKHPNRRFWVNYCGADELSEGLYETCVPLRYVMDPSNDVILAYEMNDHPLPPDHGYPLRLMLPGWVGARSVKWLSKIWISDHENSSHYHIYDNRQLPSFVTDAESDLAETMYRHPSTLCNEQMLNSVIVRPAQGEKINLVDVKKGKKYRVTGYAYNGSGNEIDRVEISLDGGDNWIYCIRKVRKLVT